MSGDPVARRRDAILTLARRDGSVSVDDLAARLDVTPQTIRRDLNLLAQGHRLARTHGGAVAAAGIDNLSHAERRLAAATAKAGIGAAAAALVPNGASLFLNIGTTVEAIARHLTAHRDLMVVTNNLNVVDILAECPGIEVIAAGGRVRGHDRAVVGAVAMDFIRGFRVDVALIGASALAPDGSFLDYDLDEVHVARTIVAQARQVVLALDASKLGRAAPVRIGGLADLDFLVTDALGDADLRDACRAAGVTVVEAGEAD